MMHLDIRLCSTQRLSPHGAINFSPSWYDLQKTRYFFLKTDWRLKFAIRSGELVFSLPGATSPITGRAFVQQLPVHLQLTQQHSFEISDSSVDKTSTKTGDTYTASQHLATSPAVGLSTEHSHDSSCEMSKTHEQTIAVSQEDHEFNVISVHTTGDENNPIWTFENNRLGGYLLGFFDYKLADLDISGQEISIRAEFNTFASSLYILEVDSIEYLEMSDRKKMIVNAQLRRLLHETIRKKKCLASCTMCEE